MEGWLQVSYFHPPHASFPETTIIKRFLLLFLSISVYTTSTFQMCLYVSGLFFSQMEESTQNVAWLSSTWYLCHISWRTHASCQLCCVLSAPSMFWAVSRVGLKRCHSAVQDKYGAYQTRVSWLPYSFGCIPPWIPWARGRRGSLRPPHNFLESAREDLGTKISWR